MLTVYLCPLILGVIAFEMGGSLAAILSLVTAGCALWCVHLSYLPPRWKETPGERGARLSSLQFMAHVALFFGLLSWAVRQAMG